MKNRKLLGRGLMIAIGIFLADTLLVPLVSAKTVGRGAREGAIAGAMVMAVFAIIAWLRPQESGQRD